MSEAMVVQDARSAFEANSLQQLEKLCKVLFASRMLPKHITSPEAAFTIILAGRELGLMAMQSLRTIAMVEGKPTLSADLMAALVMQSPVCEYFSLVESSPDRVTYETRRKGSPEPVRLSFTMEQAAKADLLKGINWKKYPDAMLSARCKSALARVVYPDLMMGVYDPDELAPQKQEEIKVEIISKSKKAAEPQVEEVIHDIEHLGEQVTAA